MLISGSTLFSDCHEALIYMEGTEYHCVQCTERCRSVGTLSEVTEQRNAVPNERARLEREVIEAAKEWRITRFEQDASARMAAIKTLHSAVDALIAFEAEHKIGDR